MENSGFWVGPVDAPDTYELITELGFGGEGRVWKAVVPLSNSGRRYVAVKMLPATEQDGEREQWARYGHLLSALAHPGIVRITDVFIGPVMHRNDGSPKTGRVRYIVMDFIEGTTLREWITDHPEVTAAERIAQLRNIGSALDELHSGRTTDVPVAHGDVKPENIIIRPNGGSILVDLGMTRLTDAGGITGKSNPYAAPELHVPGTPATPESDAFAFAATLAHTLTGELPPMNDEDHLDLDALRSRMAQSSVTSHRPAMVREIVAALATPPDDRPRHLSEWLNAISATLSQTTNPVPAEHPAGLQSRAGWPPHRRRFGKLWSRKRVFATTAAAISLVALSLGWFLLPLQETAIGETASLGAPYDAATEPAADIEDDTMINGGEFDSSASEPPAPATQGVLESSAPPPLTEDASSIDATGVGEQSEDPATADPSITDEADPDFEQPNDDQSELEPNDGDETPPPDIGNQVAPVAPRELDDYVNTDERQIDPEPGDNSNPEPTTPPTTKAQPTTKNSSPLPPVIEPQVLSSRPGGNCDGKVVANGAHNHQVDGHVVATTTIYYNSATGRNCAVLTKRQYLGEQSYLALTLCNANEQCDRDWNYYAREAGPVYVDGKNMCLSITVAALSPNRTQWVLPETKITGVHCG